MHPKSVQRHFFYGLLFLVFVLTVFIFVPFISSLIVAATFAVVMQPVYKKFVKTFKHRGISAFLASFVLIIFLSVPLSFIGREVVIQTKNFTNPDQGVNPVASLISEIEAPLEKILPGGAEQISAYIVQFSGTLGDNLGAIFSGTFHTFVFFGITLFALFFFFKDGEQFEKTLVKLSPLGDTYDNEILGRLKRAVNSVIRGSLTIALIQGVLTGVGLAIFGVPNPALWGSLAFFTALVPSVGTSLVLGPSILFLFINEQFFPALGLTIWSMLIVGLIDNVLNPYLVGRGVNIHPLFVLLSVLGGLSVFGPIGFIVGPLTISLLYALLDIYKIGFKIE
ncbi:MAG: AI-2E family transporter [Candidatus Pacebacteria bacterium]|nr:AI-2E family transporter [Candidatus Paceibacterota bacterium]MBP9772756.1 AI-2E family transporter [Candidatus Paceibacterota bacterium]